MKEELWHRICSAMDGDGIFSFKKFYDHLSDEEKQAARTILLKRASNMWYWRRYFYFITPLYRHYYATTLQACAAIGLEEAKPILIKYYRKVRRKWYFNWIHLSIYGAIEWYDIKELAAEIEDDIRCFLSRRPSGWFSETQTLKWLPVTRLAWIALYRLDKKRAFEMLREIEEMKIDDENRKMYIQDIINEFHDEKMLRSFECTSKPG